MADYKTLLKQARDRITEHEKAIQSHFRSLGRRFYQDQPASPSEQLRGLIEAIKEIDETTEGHDSLIERIHRIESRQTEIREQLSENSEEIRQLTRDNAAYFESIGEAAYEYYRRNSTAAETYSAVFEPLVSLHEELSRIADEITKAEQALEEKGFFDKVVVRGRLALLRTRQANKEGSIPKYLYKIGERIVETNFPDETDSSDLRQAMEPYRLNQRRIEELRAQQTELEQERERLATELEEAGATRRPTRRVREIEGLKQENESRRAQLLQSLGELALDTDDIVPADNEDAKAVRERREAIAFEHTRIERLEAAIEAERIDAQIHRIEQEITAKNETIAGLKKEVTSLKRQKTQMISERDGAIERRGDTEDLEAIADQTEVTEHQPENSARNPGDEQQIGG
ncbi:MAG: hypothetical protein ACOCZ9_02745 [Spirochaetota bacterium]